MFNKFYLATACLAALAFGTVSCTDTGDLEARLDNLEDRVKALTGEDLSAVTLKDLPKMESMQ